MKIITIDGPAGSGKSTIAKVLATKLGYSYIDSGSLYRAFAYWVLKKNGEIKDVDIKDFKLKYSWESGRAKLVLDEEDISEKIRVEEISKQASIFAADKIVREVITKMQREIAAQNNVVLEGRDAGTVVFPNAERKFYLTASLKERAFRRGNEIKNKIKKSGEVEIAKMLDYEKIKQDIKERDYQDENREFSPLKKPEDAYELDTTGMAIDLVVKILMEKI